MTHEFVTMRDAWLRFTFDDWVVLFNICSQKTWPKVSVINKLYWDKQTDFKTYLLNHYEK